MGALIAGGRRAWISPGLDRACDLLISIAMMTILALLAGLVLCGAIVMAAEIRNAPEAYEDEMGFHIVWQNNHPETADVACVWDGTAHSLV